MRERGKKGGREEREEGWKKRKGGKGEEKEVSKFFLNTFQLFHLYNLKCLVPCLKVGFNSFLSLDLLFQQLNILVFPFI